MNEVIKNIMERRSCRSFKPEMIKEEELDLILKAGEWAPSGRGTQATVMVAVQNAESIQKLSKMNAEVMGADIDPFYGAPVVIAVFADQERPTYVEDGSVVLENMMLAASSLGIGSCWVHRARQVFSSDEGKKFKEQWGVPDSYEGIGHVVLGYPASEMPEPKPRTDGRIIKIK